MSIIDEKQLTETALRDIVSKMIVAARTAPKARGADTFEIIMAEGESVALLADKMNQMAVEHDVGFFGRDAGNLINSTVVFLIGTSIKSLGLKKCGMCGFSGCDEKNNHPAIPCVFNTGDLGIALGSAAAVCMDHRVDNRIMYTVGQAAMELGFFSPGVRIAYGIPLSSSSKNPFFDRK
jgi:uncharacterized ferredoxin-like protein